MTSLSDRLFQQIKLEQERAAALAAANATLAKNTEARAAAKTHLNQAEEQYEKLVSLRQQLDKKMQDNAIEIQALAEKHETDRKALMKVLEEQVATVNNRVETTSSRKAKADHDNSRLKEQINILETHKNSGSEKFTELMAARDKEVGSVASHIEKEGKIAELLSQQNQLTKVQLAKLTVVHDAVKQKVEGYAAKFNKVQDQLKAARAVFDESQTARERLARRLITLKGDREQSALRASRSRKDYEAEEAKCAILEKQIATLEQQTEKLMELAKVLANPDEKTTSAASEPSASAATENQ